jgi:hypothetical protein
MFTALVERKVSAVHRWRKTRRSATPANAAVAWLIRDLRR